MPRTVPRMYFFRKTGGNLVVPPSVNNTTVSLTSFSMDGVTGTKRVTVGVPLQPNTVFSSDVANAYLVNNVGTEVPCYIQDYGSRHKGIGAGTSLLTLYVEYDVTFATSNDTFTHTLKFDRSSPRSAPNILTKAGITRFTNTLQLGYSADFKKLRITGAFSYYRATDNTVVRNAGGIDLTWNMQFAPTTFTGGYILGEAFTMLRLAVCVDDVGAFFVKDIQGPINQAARDNASYYPVSDTIPTNYQVLGYANVFVANGTSFSYGTTALNAAGVTATVTGGSFTPFSNLPKEGPTAAAMPSSLSFLCATEFGGEPFGTYAQHVAAGTEQQNEIDTVIKFADESWRRDGLYSTIMAANNTTYAPNLMAWMLYAQTGHLRHARRALVFSRPVRELCNTSGWTVNEAAACLVTHLADYLLTGDTTDLTNIAKLATADEQNYLGISGAGGVSDARSHSGRMGMHIFWGMAFAERAGVNLGALWTPYTLVGDDITFADWPEASTWASVTTNTQRFQRMASRFVKFIRNGPAGGRYLNLEDYIAAPVTDPHHGIGFFMQGFWASRTLLAIQVFGDSSGLLTNIIDATNYIFDRPSPYDGVTPLYSSTPGQESFPYSIDGSAAAFPYDIVLNGCHMGIVGYLLRTEVVPKWKIRGDALLRGYYGTLNTPAKYLYAQNKNISELWMHSARWVLDRTVNIPGYTGVLGSITLNQSSIASLAVGSTFDIDVVSALDLMGDPIAVGSLSLSFSSSNSSVASVNSSTGVVTGAGAGSATITCSATLNGTTVTATCSVTVVAVAYDQDFPGTTLPSEFHTNGSGPITVGSSLLNVGIGATDSTTWVDYVGSTINGSGKTTKFKLGTTNLDVTKNLTIQFGFVDGVGKGYGITLVVNNIGALTEQVWDLTGIAGGSTLVSGTNGAGNLKGLHYQFYVSGGNIHVEYSADGSTWTNHYTGAVNTTDWTNLKPFVWITRGTANAGNFAVDRITVI